MEERVKREVSFLDGPLAGITHQTCCDQVVCLDENYERVTYVEILPGLMVVFKQTP